MTPEQEQRRGRTDGDHGGEPWFGGIQHSSGTSAEALESLSPFHG
ncbi:MAG: hypothetical protein R2724_28275 [Bryobacterales bacterium]